MIDTEEYWAKMEAELEKKAKQSPPRKNWTPREDAILVKFWGRAKIADIAEALGRSYNGVTKRASILDLTNRQ